MVSAGISNALMSNVDVSASVSTKNSKSDNNDFTKILDSQTKNSESSVKDSFSGKSEDVKSVIKKFYSDKSKPISDEENVSEDAMFDSVVKAFTEIINVIAEKLNCDVEQVEAVIDDLNIKPDEIMNNQNINKIVCEITDVKDTMGILTDETLSVAVKEIYSGVKEIIDTLEQTMDLNTTDIENLFAKIDVSEFNKDKMNFDAVAEDNGQPIEKNVSFEEEQNNIKTDLNENASLTNGENKISENENTFSKDFSDQGDSENRDSEKELAGNEITNVIANLKETILESISGEENGLADKIIKQITDDIKMYAKADTTALEIQLEPESLGKVSLTVAAKAGTVTAQLTVQNEVAKEAIESQMATLKENLNNQGIKIEAIEVTLASKEFEQNLDKEADNSEQKNSRHKKNISSEELAEINGIAADEESAMDEMMKEMGNTVNYSA